MQICIHRYMYIRLTPGTQKRATVPLPLQRPWRGNRMELAASQTWAGMADANKQETSQGCHGRCHDVKVNMRAP